MKMTFQEIRIIATGPCIANQLRDEGLLMDYEIGICCFAAKRAVLRRKIKNRLARNQNNVSEWSDMSTHGLLFQ
jgi:hypothetical protein